jgi:hypothetical protein
VGWLAILEKETDAGTGMNQYRTSCQGAWRSPAACLALPAAS